VPCVWFIIAILFTSFQARALEAPGPLDLDRPETLTWALHDNPQELHAWLKRSYRALAQKKNSVQRVRALGAYAQLVLHWNLSWDESEDMKQTAEEALQESLQQGWIDEYLHLYTLFRNPDLIKDKASPEDLTRFYQDTLDLIQRLGGSTQLLFKMQMHYAQHLESIGQLQEAIRVAKGTYEATQKDPTIPAVSKLVNLMDMADFFNKTGEMDRAKTIWDIAYRELSHSKLRSLTSVMMNSVGHQYFRQHTAESYEKAAAFYEQALKAAKDLNDQIQTAYIYVSLSRLAWKRKDHQQGIRHADRSLAILQGRAGDAWMGEAYLQKSRNQLELGLYQDSLGSVIKAQHYYDPNNLFDQRYVEQIKAEALRGLKRFDEAFAALKLAYEIDSKLAKEQSHAEVSNQLADLGLQVEQARSEVLSRQNDQKEQELKAAQRFKIILIILLLLAFLVIGLMIFSLHEKRLLAISQKKIRAILDHIDEAIVLIKPDFTIESEYSRFLESLFASAPQSLIGAHAIRDIIRNLMDNADDATLIQNALEASFHENTTVWDLNEGHLPHESQCIMQGQSRYFSLHWQAIFNSEARLVRVLLGIRDVTARKRMEEDFAAERQEKSQLFERVQELLSVDRTQAIQLFDRIHQLKQWDNMSRVRFELHSIKGVSRTLRFKQLAEAVHNMESSLTDRPAPLNWNELDTIVAGYRHILDDVLVRHESRTETEGGLAGLAASLLPDLKQRANAIQLDWQSIAIEDHLSHWHPDELETARELLLHASSNSLDHGYKFPKERGEAVAPFHLNLSCQDQNGFLQLHIQDRGAGINWSALAEKAKRLQMNWQTQAELSAVLFMEGVSTAEQLTSTSGRGVGLSAMKYSLESLGGHIEIHSRPGAGTEVICTWPRAGQKGPGQRDAS
jgi:tetratricopeptide (TPR) repeat protein